jgi:hypothetical protein
VPGCIDNNDVIRAHGVERQVLLEVEGDVKLAVYAGAYHLNSVGRWMCN